MDMNYKELKKCLCCDSDEIYKVLDLGNQRLANSFAIDENDQKFPLVMNACKECGHAQLSIAVNPDIMFRDYPYVSGTSDTLKKYFEDFAVKCLNGYSYSKETVRVLDIACNDGSQLNAIKKIAKEKNIPIETYGIDPAENLSKKSRDNGHVIYVDYFTPELTEKISSDGLKFDIIIAQNVFAHNDDPYNFLLSAEKLLTNDGILYVQTSQANMLNTGEFDTIYHEHISFFNEHSMQELIKRTNLYLVSHCKVPIHGGSFLFKIVKNIYKQKQPNNEVYYGQDKYKKFAIKSHEVKNLFLIFCELLEETNYKLIGVGAAAKGNTFLNFAGKKIYAIMDENPLKQGRLSASGVPIISGGQVADISIEHGGKIIFIPLAWNFFEEMKVKISVLTDSPNFYLHYFPSPVITYE